MILLCNYLIYYNNNNIEIDKPRRVESAEDITAAATAAKPSEDTHLGVKYFSTSGRVMA